MPRKNNALQRFNGVYGDKVYIFDYLVEIYQSPYKRHLNANTIHCKTPPIERRSFGGVFT